MSRTQIWSQMCDSKPQLRIQIWAERPKSYHAIRTRRLAQLMLPVGSRTAGIEEAVVDKDEQAEKRDEDGVEDGRDRGQEGGGGQVQQGAAVHAHQQQALRPQHNQVGPTQKTKQNISYTQ